VTWVDDKDESALLVTSVKDHTKMAPLSQTKVHHNEDNLFVHLGDKEGGGHTCRILDSGATNHMMGNKRHSQSSTPRFMGPFTSGMAL
jgi:hypothetical protein